MPKYVFEVSGKLPAGNELTYVELTYIAAALGDKLAEVSVKMNKKLGEIQIEPPFEHVTVNGPIDL